MAPYLADWFNLLVRWLHFITGIAWIGASFYFVWLDNHLRPSKAPGDQEDGVHGELWSVHGGGFYHNRKYLLGPRGHPLTEHLHWFKWEAYWTWISGMLLLGGLYWHGARTFLIDPTVAELTPLQAIAASAGLLVAGWILYDLACRFIRNEKALWIAIALLVIGADWLAFQLFSARAAYIHVGAMLGTIMVANVFFVIIPGQKKMVTEIRAGLHPDPEPGRRGKQRSVHNTYLTLPVLFVMISHHYPITYNHAHGWLALLTIAGAGVAIRRYFVLRHSGRRSVLLPIVAILLLGGTAYALAPRLAPASDIGEVSDAQLMGVIERRCASCHAANPTDRAFPAAPAGLMLDELAQVRAAAAKIHNRTVVTRDMPLANLTRITDAERDLVDAWYRQQSDDSTP